MDWENLSSNWTDAPVSLDIDIGDLIERFINVRWNEDKEMERMQRFAKGEMTLEELAAEEPAMSRHEFRRMKAELESIELKKGSKGNCDGASDLGL